MLQNPFYSSRNFSLCGKKKKQKQGEPTAFSNRWEDEEAREEGKGRGQYSPRKEFDEREFSLRGGRACKRRKEFFLTPVIPFIARGTARHSAPACNGPGYWRVAVLMNFGVHVLRETRGTSRMPPDASATLARYWRGNSRNPGGTPRGERKRLSFNLLETLISRGNLKFDTRIFVLLRIHRIDYWLLYRREEIRESLTRVKNWGYLREDIIKMWKRRAWKFISSVNYRVSRYICMDNSQCDSK